MRPIPLLLILLLLIVGLLYFFSTQAEEVPTRIIETEVSQGANAS